MNLRGATSSTPHIYRLPTEMLSRIFELGTHDSDDPNDSIDFPTQVAAVSRRFREIATSTPGLWTTINFFSRRPSWYPHGDEEYDYTYARDSLWLERSRACPLDLVMCYRDPSWTFNEEKHYFRREHMDVILSKLLPHVGRIRRFTLICDTFAPLHATLQFLEKEGSRMVALETLELYRCNEYAAEYPRFSPMALADPIPLLGGYSPPKLTRVILAGVHVDWTNSKDAFSDLKYLELTYHSKDVRPSLTDFTDILERSPNLEELTIIGSGPVSAPVTFPPTIVASPENECVLLRDVTPLSLSRVRTIKIGYYEPQDALLLLQLVDAPGTTDLVIKDIYGPSENSVAAGNSILYTLAHPEAKLFPSLTSLSLEGMRAIQEAITACFLNFKEIQTLSLDSVSQEFLPVLSELHPDGKLLCPELKRLSLRLLPNEGVGHLAEVRAKAGIPLESLMVYYRDSIRDEDIQLARRHSDVGLFGQAEEDEINLGDPEDPYALGGESLNSIS